MPLIVVGTSSGHIFHYKYDSLFFKPCDCSHQVYTLKSKNVSGTPIADLRCLFQMQSSISDISFVSLRPSEGANITHLCAVDASGLLMIKGIRSNNPNSPREEFAVQLPLSQIREMYCRNFTCNDYVDFTENLATSTVFTNNGII